MTKLTKLIEKYRQREKDGYEFTPIQELLSDLWYLRPKKRTHFGEVKSNG